MIYMSGKGETMIKRLEAARKRLLGILGEENCLADESMSRHTTFRIGGPAAIFVKAGNAEQLQQVLAVAQEEKVPAFLLGNGSNVLVSDAGYEGIVVKLAGEFEQFTPEGESLVAGGGVSLMRVANRACKEGLTGMEFATGIPGSVGGAVYMNAGAYGGEMADILEYAEVYFPGEGIRQLNARQLELGYRHSILKEKPGVVLRVRLRLQFGDKKAIMENVMRLKEARVSKQPLEYASAGSTFKRPEGAFAGKLIQDAGLAGFQVGGAVVSPKHCGFVVNVGGATAVDVMAVIRETQKRVKGSSGYELEPEVIFLGVFDR